MHSRYASSLLRRDFVIRVSGDIEPVAAPSFAVARRIQQTVHDLRERIRRFIRDKIINLFGVGSSRSGPRSRGESGSAYPQRRGLQTLFFQLGEHKAVDRSPHPEPCSSLHGDAGLLTGTKDQNARCSGVITYRNFPFLPQPPRAEGHTAPAFTRSVMSAISLSASLLLGGIFMRSWLVADGLDQQAIARFSGDYREAGLAAFLDGSRRVQAQSPHHRGGVTGVAILS